MQRLQVLVRTILCLIIFSTFICSTAGRRLRRSLRRDVTAVRASQRYAGPHCR